MIKGAKRAENRCRGTTILHPLSTLIFTLYTMDLMVYNGQQSKGSSRKMLVFLDFLRRIGTRWTSALQFKSCHLDQKTAGNLRISGFFLCNLHKDVSLAPFPCNYFATFQNVPKGRKHQYIVDLQFPDTTYCIFSSDLHNSPGKDTAWNSRAPPPSPV